MPYTMQHIVLDKMRDSDAVGACLLPAIGAEFIIDWVTAVQTILLLHIIWGKVSLVLYKLLGFDKIAGSKFN
jgi:hypothetical protein